MFAEDGAHDCQILDLSAGALACGAPILSC
jgi:hypothetical protein